MYGLNNAVAMLYLWNYFISKNSFSDVNQGYRMNNACKERRIQETLSTNSIVLCSSLILFRTKVSFYCQYRY